MFDLVASESAAAPVFAAAAQALGGRDPRHLVRHGDGVIYRNDVAQMLCCASALAFWSVLQPCAPRPRIVAGYSAGEVPAWAVAGIIGAPTAFDLVARRAALMDEESLVPSGLAAILGLQRAAVDAVCQAHRLDIAIVNGPLHFIVGGRNADLDDALLDAAGRGASRAVRLPIGVASHTPRLRSASARFGEVLRQRIAEDVRVPPAVRLVCSIDGMPVRGMRAALDRLAAQIATRIDWAACLDACRAAVPARVLELGPGDALARMMREAAPEIPARSVMHFRTVAGIRRWMEAGS